MAIPGLPGGLIIYQGNPSISPKRTPMTGTLRSTESSVSLWSCYGFASTRSSRCESRLSGMLAPDEHTKLFVNMGVSISGFSTL